LIGVPEVNRWRQFDSKNKYSAEDIVAVISGVLGSTITRMTLDLHVFTSEMTDGKKWNPKE
jgi:hypothetical protein